MVLPSSGPMDQCESTQTNKQNGEEDKIEIEVKRGMEGGRDGGDVGSGHWRAVGATVALHHP